jgi:hypothetical protein
MVFEATQVENGPPGMRARETLVFDGPDDLESTFELAMPGGAFENRLCQRMMALEPHEPRSAASRRRLGRKSVA